MPLSAPKTHQVTDASQGCVPLFPLVDCTQDESPKVPGAAPKLDMLAAMPQAVPDNWREVFMPGARRVAVKDLALDLLRSLPAPSGCKQGPCVMLLPDSPGWVQGVINSALRAAGRPICGCPPDKYVLDAVRSCATALRRASSPEITLGGLNPIALRFWAQDRGLPKTMAEPDVVAANGEERARVLGSVVPTMIVEAQAQTERLRGCYALLERRPASLPTNAPQEALLSLLEQRVAAQMELGWPTLKFKGWNGLTLAIVADAPGRCLDVDALGPLGLDEGLTREDLKAITGAPGIRNMVDQCIETINRDCLGEGRKLAIEGNGLYLVVPTPEDRAMATFRANLDAWDPRSSKDRHRDTMGVEFRGEVWEREDSFKLKFLFRWGFLKGISNQDQLTLVKHPDFPQALASALAKASEVLPPTYIYKLDLPSRALLVVTGAYNPKPRVAAASNHLPLAPVPDASQKAPLGLEWERFPGERSVLACACWEEDGYLLVAEQRHADAPDLDHLGRVSEEWEPGAVPHRDGENRVWFVPAENAEEIAQGLVELGFDAPEAFQMAAERVEAARQRLVSYGSKWVSVTLRVTVIKAKVVLAEAEGGLFPSDTSPSEIEGVLQTLAEAGKKEAERALARLKALR